MNTLTAPALPVGIPMSEDDGKRFVAAAQFACAHASTDYARPVLTTVNISTYDRTIRFVATDSYMLCAVAMDLPFLEDDLPEMDVMIDAKQLASTLPTASKVQPTFSVVVSTELLIIDNLNKTQLPKVEGVYPNWKSLLTPWTDESIMTEFHFSPIKMQKIQAAFKKAVGRNDSCVRMLTPKSVGQPIGMDIDLEGTNFKSLLMPVRKPT